MKKLTLRQREKLVRKAYRAMDYIQEISYSDEAKRECEKAMAAIREVIEKIDRL